MWTDHPKQRVILPLTGIRGLTIMWMFTFHMDNVLAALLPGLSGFVAVNAGVKFRMDLLFMLSGFLISYVYIANRGKLTRATYADFLCLRLIRLYPLYLTISLLLLFLNAISSQTVSQEFRVVLLFTLGTFLIVCVYAARRVGGAMRAAGGFLLSRRIGFWPIVLATSLFLTLLVVLGTHLNAVLGNNRPWTIIPLRLAMIQAWPWVPREDRPLAAVWFLSSLWFAYILAFPIAWLLVRRLRKPWLMFLWVFGPVALWLVVSQVDRLMEFHKVTRACCGFLCGSALFVLYANRSGFIAAAQKHLDKTVLIFLVLSVLIPALPSEGGRHTVSVLLVLGAPLLLAGTTAESSLTARFLATRPVLWLGKISYALFLSHETSLRVVDLVLPFEHFSSAPITVRILIVGAYIAFTLALATALWRFVESPAAEALKRFTLEHNKRSASRTQSQNAQTAPRPTRGRAG